MFLEKETHSNVTSGFLPITLSATPRFNRYDTMMENNGHVSASIQIARDLCYAYQGRALKTPNI